MALFRTSFRKLAPRWLTEGEGELVLYSLSLMHDVFAERTRLSALARFPSYAPPDALAPIGRDRRIVRGFDETDANYAVRLLRYLEDWRVSGNPYGLMNQILGYLGEPLDIKTVDNRGNWYRINTSGTRSFYLDQGNWDWDDEPTKWSRFWIIIHGGSLFESEGTWGDGSTWGDGGTWGTTAIESQIRSIRSIVVDWKPAGTRCKNIIIALDPVSFDPETSPGAPMPDGTWGPWSIDDMGNRIGSRLSTARYWDGV